MRATILKTPSLTSASNDSLIAWRTQRTGLLFNHNPSDGSVLPSCWPRSPPSHAKSPSKGPRHVTWNHITPTHAKIHWKTKQDMHISYQSDPWKLFISRPWTKREIEIYIYIYRERERETKGERERERERHSNVAIPPNRSRKTPCPRGRLAIP